MKKKFLSMALLVGLFGSTASLFVSCKDYDDDINKVNARVDEVAKTLETVKSDLTNQVTTLKDQLEAADNKLNTAVQKAQSGVEANAAEIANLSAQVSALSTKVNAAETAIATINSALESKVDATVFETKLAEVVAQVSSVNETLGAKITALDEKLNAMDVAYKAADAAINTQIEALKTFKATVDGYNIPQLKSDFADLSTKVTTLATDLETAKTNIAKCATKAELTTAMENVDKKVAAVNAELSNITYLVKHTLRSLVFVPDAYYWGVEATTMDYLQHQDFALAETDYKTKESVGYKEHDRYAFEEGARVLNAVARYHVNPSNAELPAELDRYEILDNDVPFENTRDSKASLFVKKTEYKDGILSVHLNAVDANEVMEVIADQKVTNFATQVTVANGENCDTTITSDYATLYTEHIKGFKIALTNNKVNGHIIDGAPVTAYSTCSVVDPNPTHYAHLMQSVFDAGFDAHSAPQVWVDWQEQGLDLETLVETHYIDAEGVHHKLTDKSVLGNLKYVFELTGYYKGDNATDESAHAAINPEDGKTFRPQMTATDGSQQAYGAEQNEASEVGRTPMVRVSLVDVETGVVYDYGYICILITTVPEPEYIEYTGKDWTYSQECTPLAWNVQTVWAQTEHDLYVEFGLTREMFEANYDFDGSEMDLTQYVLVNGEFVEAATAEGYGNLGKIRTVTDLVVAPGAGSSDGQMSSTLKWEIRGVDMYNYYTNNKYPNEVESSLFDGTKNGATHRAIRYESKNAALPDIYVMFHTGVMVENAVQAKVVWNKNENYWASTNAATMGTGLDEIHMNVPTWEDGKSTSASPFEKTLAESFDGNTLDNLKNILTYTIEDKTAGKEWDADKLTGDLIFDASNDGKNFKGISGTVYTMKVVDNGKTLEAGVLVDGDDEVTNYQKVATITSGLIDQQKVVYYEDGDINSMSHAEDLLNYVAHNELNNDALNVVVALEAKNECDHVMYLDLLDNTFNVRFLRPINIKVANAEVVDAATSEKQVIDLDELFTYTDWREAWKDECYYSHYRLEKITVGYLGNKNVPEYDYDVADGLKISRCTKVVTNQDKNQRAADKEWVPLNSLNAAIEFFYVKGTSDYGTIEYTNYGNTVSDFQVKVPVVLHYMWGKLPAEITINVKKSVENAKDFEF